MHKFKSGKLRGIIMGLSLGNEDLAGLKTLSSFVQLSHHGIELCNLSISTGAQMDRWATFWGPSHEAQSGESSNGRSSNLIVLHSSGVVLHYVVILPALFVIMDL